MSLALKFMIVITIIFKYKFYRLIAYKKRSRIYNIRREEIKYQTKLFINSIKGGKFRVSSKKG